jgi:hypothetical protein
MAHSQGEVFQWVALTVVGLVAGLALALPLGGAHLRCVGSNGRDTGGVGDSGFESGDGAVADHPEAHGVVRLVDLGERAGDGGGPHRWGDPG